MSEATDSAVEAKEKSQAVALIIAILALLLALAEAGAKNAQHRSTEHNIESSDLLQLLSGEENFARPWSKPPRQRSKRKKPRSPTPKRKTHSKSRSQTSKRPSRDTTRIPKLPKTASTGFRNAPKRRPSARTRQSSARTLRTGQRPDPDRDRAGVAAAIITGITALIWLSAALGAIGATLLAFGFLAPTVLPLAG